jgi:hypothetical protein
VSRPATRPLALLLALVACDGATHAANTFQRAAATDVLALGEPVVVVASDLTRHEGTLASLSADSVTIRDDRQRPKTLARADVLAVLFPSSDTPGDRVAPSPWGTSGDPRTPDARRVDYALQGELLTTDGQVMRGRLAPGEAPTDHLLWDGPPFGRRAIALERVSSLRPGPGSIPREPGTPTSDIVVFKNGDRAPMFIEAIRVDPPREAEDADAGVRDRAAQPIRVPRRGAPNAPQRRPQNAEPVVTRGTVTGDASGTPRQVPLERVQSLLFANPAAEPAGSPRVWLSDGTVVDVGDVRTLIATKAAPGAPARQGTREGVRETSQVQILDDAGATAAVVPLRAIRAIAFDTRGLVPLAQCDSRWAARSPDQWGWTPPVRVDDATGAALEVRDVVLPGPMVATFALPAGSRVIAGEVVLPEASHAFGTLVATLTLVDGAGRETPVARADLSGTTPRSWVSAAVPSDAAEPVTLRVDVDPLADGAIQDVLVLREFLVRVSR